MIHRNNMEERLSELCEMVSKASPAQCAAIWAFLAYINGDCAAELEKFPPAVLAEARAILSACIDDASCASVREEFSCALDLIKAQQGSIKDNK